MWSSPNPVRPKKSLATAKLKAGQKESKTDKTSSSNSDVGTKVGRRPSRLKKSDSPSAILSFSTVTSADDSDSLLTPSSSNQSASQSPSSSACPSGFQSPIPSSPLPTASPDLSPIPFTAPTTHAPINEDCNSFKSVPGEPTKSPAVRQLIPRTISLKSDPSAPLSIRSISQVQSFGTSFGGTFDSSTIGDASIKTPKSEMPSKVRFKPRLSSISSRDVSDANSHLSALSGVGRGLDVGTLLSHRLQMRADSSDGTKGEQEPLRRGFAGALGARARGQKASPQSVQSRMAMRMKKMKNKETGAKNLMEICWPDETAGFDVGMYLPLSLPYILKAEFDDGSLTQASRRPTAKLVDEANRDVASLFANADDSDADEESCGHDWSLIQFPFILPAISRTAMEEQRMQLQGEEKKETNNATPKKSRKNAEEERDENDAEAAACGSTLSALPDGKIGTLKLHASGKVKFWLNSTHSYDVNQGSECNFCQDVGCLIECNSELMMLGKCKKKIAVLPDIERMVQLTKPSFLKEEADVSYDKAHDQTAVTC